jgi:hypothetical protein
MLNLSSRRTDIVLKMDFFFKIVLGRIEKCSTTGTDKGIDNRARQLSTPEAR